MWKEIQIADVADLKYGKSLPSRDRIDGQIPVYGSGGINGYNNKALVNSGIIIGRKGTVGSVRFSKVPFFPIDTVFYIDNVSIGNDLRYFFYFLQTSKLDEFNSDAAVPGLNRNLVKKLKGKVPSYKEQVKIASILSNYDDLIEVNNKRIHLLEETAKELYKEWFVRMRFPGYRNTKFVKGIPEGWRIERLDDLVNFKTGKLNSNAATEDGLYPFFTCSTNDFKVNTYSFDTEAVLLAGNNANGIFPLKYFKGKFDAYQRTYVIKPKNNVLSHKYIYFYFLERLEFLQVISIGAATQFLTTQMLKKMWMVIPTIALMKVFSSQVDPIFKQIETLKLQNAELRKIRDRLLPRLISGKLKIKTAEEVPCL